MVDRHYLTIEDNSVAVWDGQTGKCMETYPLSGPIENPVPAPSAQQLAEELVKRLNEQS